MKTVHDVQLATDLSGQPTRDEFCTWIDAALAGAACAGEVSLKVVDEDESRRLNRHYRDQDRATNVLAFPADVHAATGSALLGDIAVCAPLVATEAHAQGKTLRSHWAHLTVHGTLHLAGFDHVSDADATVMEALEADVMRSLGFPNPYQPDERAVPDASRRES